MSIEISGTVRTDDEVGEEARRLGYTPQDLNKAEAIVRWLHERSQSRSWLAKKSRISSTAVSQVLNCKYQASPTSALDRMLAVLQVETERLGDGTPGYVEGSVHKLVSVVCDRTRRHANFGVVCGAVGVGKTRALKEYRKRKPQTVLVESNPTMTAGSLLIALLDQLGGAMPPGLDRKFDQVVRALVGTNYLLIVDEAELLSPTALHYLRRIRDKACIGVVLAGTDSLAQLLRPEKGQFDQIRSRVSMWPKTIQAISRDDADDMVREAIGGDVQGDIPDAVLDTLWCYCCGSARVLMESLLPALRDYGLGSKPLTPALVDAVAGQVLFMSRKTGG